MTTFCRDCKHLDKDGFGRADSYDWKCRATGNGVDPVSGDTIPEYCEHKNNGMCKDFKARESKAPKPNKSMPAAESQSSERYRSPLWVRIVRWLIQ